MRASAIAGALLVATCAHAVAKDWGEGWGGMNPHQRLKEVTAYIASHHYTCPLDDPKVPKTEEGRAEALDHAWLTWGVVEFWVKFKCSKGTQMAQQAPHRAARPAHVAQHPKRPPRLARLAMATPPRELTPNEVVKLRWWYEASKPTKYTRLTRR